ncbi:hypothetical protein ABEF92_003250 [Exophiala dermatitidis]|uniref:Uncharacterized protein n=1 Tax=Exophiala dermatitidis (strain ATCC 34100 / CBS 525.76 / NIH/UT8656) TaxID=858893 RepID=H6CBA5_EXODN|nr:uncharacterized protein HMPREF1120_08992 [Exophiala dermatitidis NIH/UT8656]EHY61052.1 hypothetical protein HMPREF1120_08992 [Exophiala dermatitidis NIH/UT8656]
MGATQSQPDANNVDTTREIKTEQQLSGSSSCTPAPYRRLRPVESREAVQAQAAAVQGWRLSDSSDDLYESAPIQEPRTSEGNTSVAKRAPSPDVPSSNKKQRLVPTDQALQIALECLSTEAAVEKEENNTAENTTLDHLATTDSKPKSCSLFLNSEGSPSGSEDEGYSSFSLTPPGDNGDLSEDQKEEHLVKTLAALQRPNIVLAKPAVSGEESGHTADMFGKGDHLQNAREYMLQDQEETMARSTMLRERKSSRNLVAPDSPTLVTLDRQRQFSDPPQLRSPSLDSDEISDLFVPQTPTRKTKVSTGITTRQTVQRSQAPKHEPRAGLSYATHKDQADGHSSDYGYNRSKQHGEDATTLDNSLPSGKAQYRTRGQPIRSRSRSPVNGNVFSRNGYEIRSSQHTQVNRLATNSTVSGKLDIERTRNERKSRLPPGASPISINWSSGAKQKETISRDGPRVHFAPAPRPSGPKMLSMKGSHDANINKDTAVGVSWPGLSRPYDDIKDLSDEQDAARDNQPAATLYRPQSQDISDFENRDSAGDNLPGNPLSRQQRKDFVDRINGWDTARDRQPAVTLSRPQQQDIMDVDGNRDRMRDGGGDRTTILPPFSSRRRGPPPMDMATALADPKKGLTLPPKFDTYEEDEKKAIVEHEIAKERKRDLEMIERLTQSIAQVRCLGPFTESHEEELAEAHRFISFILDEEKCGKVIRPRIQNIRDNMKRRTLGYFEPSSADVATWIDRIFTQATMDAVQRELARINELVEELGKTRAAFSAKRHNSRTKHGKRKMRACGKLAGFTSQPSAAGATGTATSPLAAPAAPPNKANTQHIPKKSTALPTQNRRQAQNASEDQRKDTINAKLKLFNDATRKAEDAREADKARIDYGVRKAGAGDKYDEACEENEAFEEDAHTSSIDLPSTEVIVAERGRASLSQSHEQQHNQWHEQSDEESEEDAGEQYVFGASWTGQAEGTATATDFTAPPSFPDMCQQSQPEPRYNDAAISQDLDEINRLEDARQTESESHALNVQQQSTGSTQRFDAELLKRMQMESKTPALKAQQQSTPSAQQFDPELLKRMQNKQMAAAQPSTTQREDLTEDVHEGIAEPEVEVEPSAISDDSDLDSSEDENDEQDDDDGYSRQIFKYRVLGAFAGVEIYKDADTYIFKTTYKPERAKEIVASIIQSVLAQHPPEGGVDAGYWTLEVSYRDGLIEQHLMVGENMGVEARVWVEKKLVTLSRKAYQAAKAQRIMQQRFLFAVEWEKTITPLSVPQDKEAEQNNNSSNPNNNGGDNGMSRAESQDHKQQQGRQNQDDIGLFGEDSPTMHVAVDVSVTTGTAAEASSTTVSTPAPVPVVTTIPTNEIQYFTTPILANRHAKDIYMSWHALFLPGVRNEGYRRLEEEAIERDLATLAETSWGLWARDETFEGIEVDTGRRVQERFKVWVRRIEVFGPAN